jgi:hypothetical protein
MQGGLGNQLFQYAAGRAVSARLGSKLLLDLTWHRRLPRGATPRAFELGCYPIAATCLDPDDEQSLRFWSVERLGCVVQVDGRLRWARSFRERGLRHDPRMARLGDDRMLEGYWQSPQYFTDVAEALRRELRPIIAMDAEDARVAGLIASDPHQAVAVHVRRGDYLSGVHAEHHGLCGLEYYQRAFVHMRASMQSPRLFVFSDDPDWVALHASVFGDAFLVAHNGPLTAYQDLRLMSLCRAHVIANSSFSWWGAWLSDHESKLVIAPAKWHLGSGGDAADLTPPEWVRL